MMQKDISNNQNNINPSAEKVIQDIEELRVLFDKLPQEQREAVVAFAGFLYYKKKGIIL